MIHKIVYIERLYLIGGAVDDCYQAVYAKRLRRENDRIAYINERQRTWNFIEMIRSERYVN